MLKLLLLAVLAAAVLPGVGIWSAFVTLCGASMLWMLGVAVFVLGLAIHSSVRGSLVP